MWLPALATLFYFTGMGGITVMILWIMYGVGMLGEGFTNKYQVENNEELDSSRSRVDIPSDAMVSPFS